MHMRYHSRIPDFSQILQIYLQVSGLFRVFPHERKANCCFTGTEDLLFATRTLPGHSYSSEGWASLRASATRSFRSAPVCFDSLC
jgi:hypothetical protein